MSDQRNNSEQYVGKHHSASGITVPHHGLGIRSLPHNSQVPTSQLIPAYSSTVNGYPYARPPFESDQLTRDMEILEVTGYTPTGGVAGDQVGVSIRSRTDILNIENAMIIVVFNGVNRPVTVRSATSDAESGVFQYTLSFRIPQLQATTGSSLQCLMHLSIKAHNQQIIGAPIGHFMLHEESSVGQTRQSPDLATNSASSVKDEGNEDSCVADLVSSRRSSTIFSTESNTSGPGPSPHHEQTPFEKAVIGSGSFGMQTQRSYHQTYGPVQNSQLPTHIKRSSSVPSPRNAEHGHSVVSQIRSSAYSASQSSGHPGSVATQLGRSPTSSSRMGTTFNPTLVRTSTLNNTTSPTGGGFGAVPPAPSSFGAQAMPSSKAFLKLDSDLDRMTSEWSVEEKEARRRLVEFKRNQKGNTITAAFKPITLEQRAPNSICVSCIWWEEKEDYFVTSVDTIQLLESLVGVRFTVEEKNRIRRNLEGFRPLTVAKGKPDSEHFFKIIMDFPNPKPRNIEKDVKVFPWKILTNALKKIIGKYSASYASTASSLHPSSAFEYANASSSGEPTRYSVSPTSQTSSTISVGQGSMTGSASDSPYLQASAPTSAPIEYQSSYPRQSSWPAPHPAPISVPQPAQYMPYVPVGYSWPQQEPVTAAYQQGQPFYPTGNWISQYGIQGSTTVTSPPQFGPVQAQNLPLQQRRASQVLPGTEQYLRHVTQP